jgi:hypothetical protein
MNPYDAKNGGTKAMIFTQVISRPKDNPYQATKPIIKKVKR